MVVKCLLSISKGGNGQHEMISDQKCGTHAKHPHAHRGRASARERAVYYYTLSIIQAQLIINEHRNVPAAAKGVRAEENMFFGQKHNKHTFRIVPPSN